jgi:hypothetical protein
MRLIKILLNEYLKKLRMKDSEKRYGKEGTEQMHG